MTPGWGGWGAGAATQRDCMLRLALSLLTSNALLPYGYSVIGDGVHYSLARTNLLKENATKMETRLSKMYDMRDETDAKALFRLVVAAARAAVQVRGASTRGIGR